MAQWKMLSDICKKDKKKGERLQQLYSTDNFPHKIRSTFAAWIESVDWDSLEKESNGQSGRVYFEHLISLIDDRCDSSEMDQILDLKRSKEQEFQNNYLPFIKVINNKLRQEQMIIESSITDQNSDPKRKPLRSNINNNNNNDDNSNNNEKEEAMSRYLFNLNQLDLRQRAITFQINNCIVEQGVFIERFDTKFEKYRALQETTSTKGTKESLKIEILRSIYDLNSLRKEVAKEILKLSNELFLASRSVWDERSYWLIAQKKEIYSVTNGNLLNIDDLDTLFVIGQENFYYL
ncbi:hypothetical protein HELRODRAFT_159760 [Helobdella robusta]|uniref:STAT transcription factor protein interaction domain-containing protein n=1 Tax=Helobdella robusta TaxID=6412 RepID=T1EPD4_HELRO|nr:hypothetical protein HELRODRAFT_159760 [Helobdella robusta]ESO13137.1 hypothetical protein HELRODRAFT_159760 [Helobdella robusta]